MRSPEFVCVLFEGMLPGINDHVKFGDVITRLRVLHADEPKDFYGVNVVYIMPGQEHHPLFEFARRNLQSRLGLDYAHACVAGGGVDGEEKSPT